MASNPWYLWRKEILQLEIQLVPRAGKDAVDGLHDGRLRIHITAPPVDGKANRHLVTLLAGEFDVPKTAVSIIRGEKSRRKSVQIHAPENLPSWFMALTNQPG